MNQHLWFYIVSNGKRAGEEELISRINKIACHTLCSPLSEIIAPTRIIFDEIARNFYFVTQEIERYLEELDQQSEKQTKCEVLIVQQSNSQ